MAKRSGTTRAKNTPKAPKQPSGANSKAAPRVRVRMYRQGLGDCFLITFGDGPTAKHMLIDCGTLGLTKPRTSKIEKVVENIATETGGKLAVLVATHEHKDHLSGFNSEREVFSKFAGHVEHVWLAWTEDPQDPDAKKIAKYENDLGAALRASLAATPLDSRGPDGALLPESLAGLAIRDLLDFAGEPTVLGADSFAETIDAAMKFVRDELGVRPTYLSPGGEAVEIPEIPGFRFYVLGPPRGEASLGDLGEHGSSHLYGLRAAAESRCRRPAESDAAAEMQSRIESSMPFDQQFRIGLEHRGEIGLGSYDEAGAAWRRIDGDWNHAATDLALQLDSLTNNTSLALAIERVADGRVLLFPADAQLGNWLSWNELKWKIKDTSGAARVVTTDDLLHRTVFYKVGHHGSHNATLKDALEKMAKENELVAFIPVDRGIALSRHPEGTWRMPARALYRRLLEKCQGRVVRADLGWAEDAAVAQDKKTEQELAGLATGSEWKAWKLNQTRASASVDPGKNDLYVDYVLG